MIVAYLKRSLYPPRLTFQPQNSFVRFVVRQQYTLHRVHRALRIDAWIQCYSFFRSCSSLSREFFDSQTLCIDILYSPYRSLFWNSVRKAIFTSMRFLCIVILCHSSSFNTNSKKKKKQLCKCQIEDLLHIDYHISRERWIKWQYTCIHKRM